MRNVYHAIGKLRAAGVLQVVVALLLLTTMTSCYRERLHTFNENTEDTLFLEGSHHYSVGYNFVVNSDSIILISQQPEEHVSQLQTDSFSIPRNQHLAVSDIHILPQDSIDSVWVQVVSEKGRLGWIHEKEMLASVVPTDPISQFIMFFSRTHTMLAVILVVIMAAIYIMRLSTLKNAHLVHVRDIDSFYPTLLCIIVACSATFYASLQMFGPDTWQHFYFHPSINPFVMPPILGIFITSVWAMLIVGIATIDDVRHKLPPEEAILYLFGLMGVCSLLYIIFSISTLYYIGYPLLGAYCYYAVTKYFRRA